MASLGYTLPGTTIEEIQNPASVNPTTTQRTPCFIGVASSYVKVTFEAVVRSSTGLVDDLEYTSEGIYEVIECGSQRGLSDYVEGTDFNVTNDQIVWTSSGIVTVGATYFVTYRYNRPSSDYIYKEFTSYEDVTTDLGDDIPDHPLVMISKLALRYYSLPKIAIVQVPSTETSTDYANAIDATKYRDVQTVCALTTNTTVQAYLINHVLERSLKDNGRYRVTYMGMPVGTPIGSDSDPTSIKGKAVSILQERVSLVNATRALYYYNDLTTGEEASTVVDGAFIAATVAAFRDSFIGPTTTLLNKILSGIELSVFILTDGNSYVILPEAKDYKKIGEGDTGLNTGGMGAVSPVPFADTVFMKKIEDRIIKPTINGLQNEGIRYTGFIFFGLINCNNDPYVNEYNVRMGDPETEAVIPRIKDDLIELLLATCNGTLSEKQIHFDDRTVSTVVLVMNFIDN